MFGGIIKQLGTVREIINWKSTTSQIPCLLEVDGNFFSTLDIGQSVAVNGICLSITDFKAQNQAVMMISSHTRSCCTPMQIAQQVHVEQPLRVGDFVGGHFIYGHIDAIGTLIASNSINQHKLEKSGDMIFQVSPEYLKYLHKQASITIDGVSLTVIERDVKAETFTVHLLDHTRNVTLLEQNSAKLHFNLEFDNIAKQIDSSLQNMRAEY